MSQENAELVRRTIDAYGRGDLDNDRPRERWTDAAGRLVLANEPLDLEVILSASAG